MRMITRKEVLEVLKEHGWKATDQTEALNSEWVQSGSSFDDVYGVCERYDLDDVLVWLGY